MLNLGSVLHSKGLLRHCNSSRSIRSSRLSGFPNFIFKSMMSKEGLTENKISCVIYDSLMYFAEATAQHVKLPSMAFCESSIGTLLLFSEFPRLQKNGYLPLKRYLQSSDVSIHKKLSDVINMHRKFFVTSSDVTLKKHVSDVA